MLNKGVPRRLHLCVHNARVPFDPLVSFKPVFKKGKCVAFQRYGTRPESNADSRDVGASRAQHHRNKRLAPVKWWSNDSTELRLI